MKNKNNSLSKLKKKLNRAQEYGLSLQEYGGKIVSYAEKALEIINFLENNKEKIPEYNAWVVGSGDFIPTHPPQNLGQIRGYTMALGTSTSTVAAYSFSSDIDLFNLDKKPIVDFLRNYDVDMDELDNYLKDFSSKYKDIGDLVAMRKDAWKVYNSAIESRLVFTSHGMREILSKIISKLADNNAVMKAEWWKPPKKKETPDLRQRLRYLLFGPKKKEDKALVMITEVVEKSFKADDNLKKVAHGSKGIKKEVKNALRITEYALLTIFRARKARYKK